METIHYNDVIKSAMASQTTGLWIVCSTVGSGGDQRKHQSSASLAFVRGIHRWPVISPHKWPVTRKMFPFDDVIMKEQGLSTSPPAIQIGISEMLTRLIGKWTLKRHNGWHRLHRITVTSHENYGISNHWQLKYLLKHWFKTKERFNALYYWPFVNEIHW